MTINDRWPNHYPSPATVQLALFECPGDTSPLGHPDFGQKELIDLETLMAIEKYQSERTRCAVFDLKDVKIDYRVWIIVLVGVALSLLGLATLPDDWVDCRTFAGILFGAAMSSSLLISPILLSKRVAIAKQISLPYDLAPKCRNRRGRGHIK